MIKFQSQDFFDVELVSGNEGNITIKGEENLLSYIKIEVVDQVLKIAIEKNKYISTSKGKKIEIIIPFENISHVSLTGSGNVISKSTIKSESFSAQLIGSGDLNLNVEATDFSINLSGSGDVVLKGQAENFNTDLNGSGDIDGGDFKAKNAKISISGSGDTTVFCSENLYSRVSGSGDIEYKDDPMKKDTKVNASSTISKT